jgi:inosose dehydratase
MMKNNRRTFLGGLVSASVGTLLMSSFSEHKKTNRFPISCNTYNWATFYKREGKSWGEDWEACIAHFAQTGIPAIEPSFNNPTEVNKIAPILQKYHIQMPSIYVNSLLHKAEEGEKSIASILAIAEEVKKVGTKIIVTNPSPIAWGSKEVKTDEQLLEQSKNMEKLGTALRNKGLILAYHTHDTELLAGAREFHHILLNTTPKNVSFCFDVHWVYRGSQNSQVAVFDVLKLYGSRVVELHIRQSVGGIWSETFSEGDIDYRRFAQELKKMKISPHLVIEQCIEDKSPSTTDVVTAHKKDLEVVKEIFT